MNDNTIYQFRVENLQGAEVDLSEYRGKVLLIVNTASECGFTPQLKELEELRQYFEKEDFEILAFPSNDFGQQEPLDGEAIRKFCSIHYHTHFTIFHKIHVRGPYVHPLYRFLSEKKLNGRVGAPPRWNFHKYLINRMDRCRIIFTPLQNPILPSSKSGSINYCITTHHPGEAGMIKHEARQADII